MNTRHAAMELHSSIYTLCRAHLLAKHIKIKMSITQCTRTLQPDQNRNCLYNSVHCGTIYYCHSICTTIIFNAIKHCFCFNQICNYIIRWNDSRWWWQSYKLVASLQAIHWIKWLLPGLALSEIELVKIYLSIWSCCCRSNMYVIWSFLAGREINYSQILIDSVNSLLSSGKFVSEEWNQLEFVHWKCN